MTRLYSKTDFIGLEAIPFDIIASNSRIDIEIRPFQASDVNSLKEEFRHARLVKAQIPECYVATTKHNKTIYRQWVFTHESQQQVLDYFGPVFPQINKHEAIIEGVFTHPDYRGLGVMTNAMTKIIQQQHYKKLTRVIAFVEEQNKASLKGFYKLGFSPYIIRKEVWILFRRKVFLKELTDQHQIKYLNAFL